MAKRESRERTDAVSPPTIGVTHYVAVESQSGDDSGETLIHELTATNMVDAIAEAATHEHAYWTDEIYVYGVVERGQVDLASIRRKRAEEVERRLLETQRERDLAQLAELKSKYPEAK